MIRGASVCLGTMGRDSGTLQVLAEHDEGWYDSGDLTVPDGRAATGWSDGLRTGSAALS